jgi:RloB-like protein
MGSDDLHHKRKAKAVDSLERRKAKRASYDRVLIVCEGEKTEPNYFNELIDYYKLNTANVAIDGKCGSSPRNVFERALELWNREDRKGDSFDRVYCVFDKDNHESYDETLNRISRAKPRNVFCSAVSVPCFEYWILLHFNYSTRPYAATHSASVGDQVFKELKGLMPTYEKGCKGIFSLLNDQVEFAKKNAERALANADKNHTDNPSTQIHKLIHYLQNLKQ